MAPSLPDAAALPAPPPTAPRSAEARLEAILSSMTMAFFALDRDWRFTYANPQAGPLLNREPAALVGRGIWDEFPEAVGSIFYTHYHQAVAQQAPVAFTAYYPPLERWFDVNAFPYEDGLAVFFTDVNERKAQEEALTQSEARFRSLVEATSAIVWTTPASGEFETEQPGWSAYTGQPFEAYQGWGWLEAVHPDDRAATVRAWTQALAARALYQSEHRLRRHDGVYRHMVARAAPVAKPDGTIREWVGTYSDVDDRRQAGEALRQREAQLRFMADVMPQMVWTTRPDGHHEYFNRQWYAYTGLPEGATDGWGWADVLHPDDYDRALARWTHSLETGTPYEIEYRLRRHDGVYRWQLSRALPHRDEDDHIVQWVGTCTDIHDQKRAEEAREQLLRALDVERARLGQLNETLEERVAQRTAELTAANAQLQEAQASLALSNARLRGIVEGTTDLIAAIDAEHCFITFNRAYAQVFGRIFKQTIHAGLCLSDLLPSLGDEERALLSETWERALAGEEFTVIQAFGAERERRVYEITYSPIRDDAGERIGAAQIGRDITERVAAEQALALMNARLEEANRTLQHRNRELQDFAYVASHDLQEPLRKIQAFADMLQTEHAAHIDAEGQFFLTRMREAAHRMSRLIHDLLAFSRVTTKAQPFAEVDLGALVQEVLSDLEVRLAETGGTVEVGALPAIEADATQMRQLFQNLIGNALKFHRKGSAPSIRIAGSLLAPPASRQDPSPMVQLVVEDDGIGFDTKYTDRIFAPFQRLHSRGEYEGTGMGLAICRRIVERHGGTIAAESTPGAGSRFVITLPQRQATPG